MQTHLSILFLLLPAAFAARWTFEDAKLHITGPSGKQRQYDFSPSNPLTTPIAIEPSDSLTLNLKAHDGMKHARPQQAALIVHDPLSGLESHFVITARDSGKASLSLKYSDIPKPLLSSEVLTLTIILASFGKSAPFSQVIAQLQLPPFLSPSVPLSSLLPEITHTFRPDPPLPHTFIAAVSALIPFVVFLFLVTSWFGAGANIDAMNSAFTDAPVAHLLFCLSIITYEGLFYAYWISVNLPSVLVYSAALAPIVFFSGRQALGEVMKRRRKDEHQDMGGNTRLSSPK